MTYEQYSALSAEEKMIARFASLRNVALASGFEMIDPTPATSVDHDANTTNDGAGLLNGVVTAATDFNRGIVTVRIGKNQHMNPVSQKGPPVSKSRTGQSDANWVKVGDRVQIIGASETFESGPRPQKR